jgi:sodium-dependent dicarboxylate transporter 2/3/5
MKISKKLIGAALAAAVILFSMFLPATPALTQAGWRTAGLLAAFLIMLVSEALPVIVVSLLFCSLMPILGITKGFGPALSGYAEPIVFFTLASFGIAAALTSIPLSKRMLRALLKKSGGSIEQVLLAMMVSCSLLSSIVSNVPTCAIFMTLALDFLKLYKDPREQRQAGRAFMIAIPVASMIGGMMTPAGSSINLLAISQLEKYTGTTITFVEWMAAGIPMAALMIWLAWYLMCRIYRPTPVSRQQIDSFIAGMDIPDQMGAKEKKVLVITLVMLGLWIASSWIRSISVMVVAMIGCCVMFFPGVEVLDVDTFVRENSWDAFFMVGAVISIAEAMINNGVSAAIAGAIPSVSAGLPVILAFTALVIFITLVIIPVATSMIPIMAVPLLAIAANSGANPALIMLTAALCAGNCYLLPLDTVPLITYSKGYYSMTDMAKSTIFLQLAMIALCALWLPLLSGLF